MGSVWVALKLLRGGLSFSEWVHAASFLLEQGTQRGCPLSPEPLSISLGSHPDIRSLRSGSLLETVGMYAGGMILYVEDTDPLLHATLQVIEEFGADSVLCVNWGKSQILPLDSYPPIM